MHVDSRNPSMVDDPLASPPELPEDWAARLRALPGSSLIHIPSAVRVRWTTVALKCWSGMAHSEEAVREKWWEIEEGRTKLLLCNFRKGTHAPKEVAIRLQMWQEGKMEELLSLFLRPAAPNTDPVLEKVLCTQKH